MKVKTVMHYLSPYKVQPESGLSLSIYPEKEGGGAKDFCATMYRLDLPGQSLVIDPSQALFDAPVDRALEPGRLLLLASHGHFDHVAACDAWRERFGAELAIHRGDAPLLADAMLNGSAFFGSPRAFLPAENKLTDGQTLGLVGGYSLLVIHSPGHSRGSVCFLLLNAENKPLLLFSGDTLFCGGVGRSDLAGGDPRVLNQSLKKLKQMAADWPDDLALYPGHGPAGTLGRELSYNPWLARL